MRRCAYLAACQFAGGSPPVPEYAGESIPVLSVRYTCMTPSLFRPVLQCLYPLDAALALEEVCFPAHDPRVLGSRHSASLAAAASLPASSHLQNISDLLLQESPASSPALDPSTRSGQSGISMPYESQLGHQAVLGKSRPSSSSLIASRAGGSHPPDLVGRGGLPLLSILSAGNLVHTRPAEALRSCVATDGLGRLGRG